MNDEHAGAESIGDLAETTIDAYERASHKLDRTLNMIDEIRGLATFLARDPPGTTTQEREAAEHALQVIEEFFPSEHDSLDEIPTAPSTNRIPEEFIPDGEMWVGNAEEENDG